MEVIKALDLRTRRHHGLRPGHFCTQPAFFCKEVHAAGAKRPYFPLLLLDHCLGAAQPWVLDGFLVATCHKQDLAHQLLDLRASSALLAHSQHGGPERRLAARRHRGAGDCCTHAGGAVRLLRCAQMKVEVAWPSNKQHPCAASRRTAAWQAVACSSESCIILKRSP